MAVEDPGPEAEVLSAALCDGTWYGEAAARSWLDSSEVSEGETSK